jgi:hypothetical protein
MASDGYLLGLLADGARPFGYRPGVLRLLGLPVPTGVQVRFRSLPTSPALFALASAGREFAVGPAPFGPARLGRPSTAYASPGPPSLGPPAHPAAASNRPSPGPLEPGRPAARMSEVLSIPEVPAGGPADRPPTPAADPSAAAGPHPADHVADRHVAGHPTDHRRPGSRPGSSAEVIVPGPAPHARRAKPAPDGSPLPDGGPLRQGGPLPQGGLLPDGGPLPQGSPAPAGPAAPQPTPGQVTGPVPRRMDPSARTAAPKARPSPVASPVAALTDTPTAVPAPVDPIPAAGVLRSPRVPLRQADAAEPGQVIRLDPPPSPLQAPTRPQRRSAAPQPAAPAAHRARTAGEQEPWAPPADAGPPVPPRVITVTSPQGRPAFWERRRLARVRTRAVR